MRWLKQDKNQLEPKKVVVANLFILAIFFFTAVTIFLKNYSYLELTLRFVIFPLWAWLFLSYFKQFKYSSAAKKKPGYVRQFSGAQASLKGRLALNLAGQRKIQKSALDLNKILSGPVSWAEFVRASGYDEQKLNKKKKYLQVAFNNSLSEAKKILGQLPVSEQVIIEVGTPLLKIYGARAVSYLRKITPLAYYLVADSKVMDMGEKEVELLAQAGAQAITCLGAAPPETINAFCAACQKHKVEAMIDMMNVSRPLAVLKKLKQLPKVVILHRGVDETAVSFPRQIPYYQIKQIKGSFDVLVSVAGGDSLREVQSAFFNGADIVVLWQQFMRAEQAGADFARKVLDLIKADSFNSPDFAPTGQTLELAGLPAGQAASFE